MNFTNINGGLAAPRSAVAALKVWRETITATPHSDKRLKTMLLHAWNSTWQRAETEAADAGDVPGRIISAAAYGLISTRITNFLTGEGTLRIFDRALAGVEEIIAKKEAENGTVR